MLPLCCIINQQYRIVTGCWSLVVDSRMTAFKIVGVDIFPYRLSSLTYIGILGKVCFFVFETAKPSFNHDIVCPPTFTIHALADAVLFEEIHVFVARKLTSLIRVQDNGFRHLKCLFQCVYDHSGIQCIINLPAYNTAAIPVNYGCQIQESTFDRDVGNVRLTMPDSDDR